MIQKQQFNTYKNEVDLNFLREYCIEHGEKRTMKRDETITIRGTGTLIHAKELYQLTCPS